MEGPDTRDLRSGTSSRTDHRRWRPRKPLAGLLNSSHVPLTNNSTDTELIPKGTSFIVNTGHQPNAAGVYRISIPGTGYRAFTNTRAYLWPPSEKPIKFCIDSGSSISLIDCLVLLQHFPSIHPHYMPDGQSVHLEGIGNRLTTNEFIILPITLHGLNDQKVRLHGEVHVVDTLCCGILIGNNILRPSKMEIRWACAEANGKDALQVGQVYIPIFSKSMQS